jgi:hypothetical protein
VTVTLADAVAEALQLAIDLLPEVIVLVDDADGAFGKVQSIYEHLIISKTPVTKLRPSTPDPNVNAFTYIPRLHPHNSGLLSSPSCRHWMVLVAHMDKENDHDHYGCHRKIRLEQTELGAQPARWRPVDRLSQPSELGSRLAKPFPFAGE